MLGCNKPEELILFEHFYCTYNYNWDWAQDRPLPIQVYNTVKRMYAQHLRTTNYMTVIYKVSMVYKNQLNLFRHSSYVSQVSLQY